MKIKNIGARKILNSEGNWTIECTLCSKDDVEATASTPQGISTGREEKSPVKTEKALEQITTEIASVLIRQPHLNQQRLDEILLSNPKWGSNATLAVSAAFFKLNQIKNPPYVQSGKSPKLMVLVFEGEKHGNPNLTIQEFMVVVDRINEGINFYKKIRSQLEQKKVITTTGSEGGFSPPDFNDKDILDIMKASGASKIALDVVGNINPPSITSLLNIVRRYPIISLEDPFPENELNSWKEFFTRARAMKSEILIVADDLTVTDPQKISTGGQEGLFNAVIIKPNQQGTISQAIEAIRVAKKNQIKTIVSHRGQETNDDWIVDLAILNEVDFVKFGAPCRGERVAKYNRLLKLTSD